MDYLELHDHLKGLGYVIYAGQGDLASTIFRIATMGDLRAEEIETFSNAIGSFIRNGST